MATCICGNWIRNPSYTSDPNYDSLCEECKGFEDFTSSPSGDDLMRITLDDYNKNLYEKR